MGLLRSGRTRKNTSTSSPVELQLTCLRNLRMIRTNNPRAQVDQMKTRSSSSVTSVSITRITPSNPCVTLPRSNTHTGLTSEQFRNQPTSSLLSNSVTRWLVLPVFPHLEIKKPNQVASGQYWFTAVPDADVPVHSAPSIV